MERLDLLDSLNLTKGALASADYLPILKHFIFEEGTVMAWNDVMAIEVPVDDMAIDCAIQGDILIKLLGSIQTDSVDFVKTSDHEITLKSGKSKFKLPFLPSSDSVFELPADIDNPAVSFKASASFLMGLDKCLTTVGDDHDHKWQHGVMLTGSGKQAVIYSTDNLSISKFTCSKDNWEGSLDEGVLMPTDFCRALIKISDQIGDEDVVIKVSSDWISAEIDDGDVLIFSKTGDVSAIKGDDPYEERFDMFVTKDSLSKVRELNSNFNAIIDRAALMMSKEPSKKITITIVDEGINIKSSSRFGDGDETYEIEHDMDTVTIFADPALLVRACRSARKAVFLEDVAVFSDGSYVQLVSYLYE